MGPFPLEPCLTLTSRSKVKIPQPPSRLPFLATQPALPAAVWKTSLPQRTAHYPVLWDSDNLAAGDHDLTRCNYNSTLQPCPAARNTPGDLSWVRVCAPLFQAWLVLECCSASVNSCHVSSQRWPIPMAGEVIPVFGYRCRVLEPLVMKGMS